MTGLAQPFSPGNPAVARSFQYSAFVSRVAGRRRRADHDRIRVHTTPREPDSRPWDPPFRRSALDIGLPLLIVAPAFHAFVTTKATIPVPRRGKPGFHGMQVDGLLAIPWGFLLIAISTAHHGR